MLEPGVSEIGAVVGSYSAAHRVDNSVELPHVSCITERKMNDSVRDEISVTVLVASHSTRPLFSLPPPAHSFHIGPGVINNNP